MAEPVSYKTVYRGGEGEYEEKKSRFIAHTAGVTTPEEAAEFIAGIKKKYWDARHNCSAFVLGDNRQISRSSDDGEPSGTAGKPILEVINGQGLTDVCVVVTRYFGGVLLGTGGLVRAYTRAAQEGLNASILIEKRKGVKLSVSVDYSLEGKLRTYFRERELFISDCIYSDSVTLITVVPVPEVQKLKEEVTELTDGRGRVQEGDEVVFAVADGELLIF